jgi:heavy metal sensor kinase
MRLRLDLGNLRLRLTLWFGSAFALLLLLHIGVATYVHYRQLVSQVFHAEIQDLETVEGLLYQGPNGQILLNEKYFNRPQLRLRLDRLLEVLSPEGEVLYRGDRLNGLNLGGTPLPDEGKGDDYNERTIRLDDGRDVLVISHFHLLNGRPILLRVGYDEAPLRANVVRFLLLLLALAPVTIIVAVLVVFRITERALSPLSTMVRRAERITAEKLNERLPVHNEADDLGNAAKVFNELLQRLEDSFRQLKRFTSDASHELRTPLASLRSIGEVSLRNSHTNDEYRDVIASMLEEVRRLTRLVESLLVISRADSGQIALQLATVPLVNLIEEVQDLVGILAEDKHQTLRVQGDPQLSIEADRSILRHAIVNLIDNAIKYSPEGGEIVIDVHEASNAAVEITFTDHGTGIPADERDLIFDRFYRADEGRSREKGGTGLGLSIAKWAVEVHKGKIGVDPDFKQGSRFYIRLPLSRAPRNERSEI